MRMPILDMLGLGHIIHPADGAVTGFFTSASFAVHGANVGRGILFALAMMGFSVGCVMILALMS